MTDNHSDPRAILTWARASGATQVTISRELFEHLVNSLSASGPVEFNPDDPLLVQQAKLIAVNIQQFHGWQDHIDLITAHAHADVLADDLALLAPPPPDSGKEDLVYAPDGVSWKQHALDLAKERPLTIEQIRASRDSGNTRLAQPAGAGEGADDFPFKEALHDLVQLRSEEWAIGGGPGFKERLEKAWRAAEELFEP